MKPPGAARPRPPRRVAHKRIGTAREAVEPPGAAAQTPPLTRRQATPTTRPARSELDTVIGLLTLGDD